jgi:Raf kinase inhibitor-like YbhB/YbcL family protein
MRRALIALFGLICAARVHGFELTSIDLAEGGPLNHAQVYRGFGCEGENLAPSLRWRNIPTGTRSLAVTVYDPDAPTGSGWWHWVVYDIPATADGLPGGAAAAPLPAGARQGRNDFGERSFGGACPPPGDKPHRYIVTVHALKVEKLNVPEDASPALIGFMLHSNSVGRAQITATYAR